MLGDGVSDLSKMLASPVLPYGHLHQRVVFVFLFVCVCVCVCVCICVCARERESARARERERERESGRERIMFRETHTCVNHRHAVRAQK